MRVWRTYHGHGSPTWVAALIDLALPAPSVTPFLRCRYCSKGSSQGNARQQSTVACAAKLAARNFVFNVTMSPLHDDLVDRRVFDLENVAVRSANVAARDHVFGQFPPLELTHQENVDVVSR